MTRWDLSIFGAAVGGNSVGRWLLSVIAALLFYLVLTAAKTFIARAIPRICVWLRPATRELLVRLVRDTNRALFAVIAAAAALTMVKVPLLVIHTAEKLVLIGLLLQAGVWTSAVVSAMLSRYRTSKQSAEGDQATLSALGLITFAAQSLVWTLVLLLVLQNFDIDVTALITGLGVGGIAVALAMQSILSDLLASLTIVLDKPFVVGDAITVGAFTGTVEKIGIKTTRLRSAGGEELIFPNADLMKSQIRNFKRMRERIVVFTFAVTYQTSEEKLLAIPQLIRQIVEKHPDLAFDRAHLKGFGDSGLLFEAAYRVLSADFALYMERQQELYLQLYASMQRAGIDLAYPTQTLIVQTRERAA